MEKTTMRAAPAATVCVLMIGLLVSACGVKSPAAPSIVSTAPTTAAGPETSPSYDALVSEGFADPSIPRITAEDLKLEMDRGAKMILIDNRSALLFQEGHLPGAISIPYAVGMPSAEDAMNRALKALPDETMKILYCS